MIAVRCQASTLGTYLITLAENDLEWTGSVTGKPESGLLQYLRGKLAAMRKAQKREALEFIASLQQAHEEIKKTLQQKKYGSAQTMLCECQEFAVALGESIEKTEGEGHITVFYVENYCETLFRVFEEVGRGQFNENKIYKILRKQLLAVENSVKNDISVKKEMVFFPYKASMWDSLESVYLAAKEDPECDAYCVPIPYYDLNPDHSFGRMHYEGELYPDYVEVTDWQQYRFEERKPDVIYIHNPYDNCNLVTSVHPRFYSSNLKKYTDLLVYIPYYSTSGGMSEAQSLCPAYLYADYIVIQAPGFRKYFDENLPDRKFLPFGSPKFDRVIRLCKNPPEPPAEWSVKMTGKDGMRRSVFFYNTSIGGMLSDTENFLKKMKYVFTCFGKREDVCLLWRPHPLLETTFDSMRPQYRQEYEALKAFFLEKDTGILDTTSDVSVSVALSDAYIGDAGTSITSLFGVAGKPVFILDNRILEELDAGEWRKKIHSLFYFCEQNQSAQNQFAVIQGNKLYVSDADRYQYRYFCDLPEDSHIHYYFLSGNDGKSYACPIDAQHILVIGKNGVEKKIELKETEEEDEMFSFPRRYGKYILLPPVNYPALVRYDTVTGEIKYFTEHIDCYVREKNDQKITGGSLIYQGNLYIASPVDNMIYRLDIESGRSSMIELPLQSRCGGNVVIEYDNEIWITPYDGQVIVRWNPKTNEVREYEEVPKDFLCRKFTDHSVCMERPFCTPACYENCMYLPPFQANMSLKLNMDTGEFEQWIPDFDSEENKADNSVFNECCMFINWKIEGDKNDFRIYSFSRRRLYSMNPDGTVFREIPIQVAMDELENSEPGFCKCSETLPYACVENCFNTLDRLLDGKILGNPFSQEKQAEAYRDIAVSQVGGCGEKVHEFVKKAEK